MTKCRPIRKIKSSSLKQESVNIIWSPEVCRKTQFAIMRGESLHLGNLMHVIFLLKSCEMGYNTFVNSLCCDTCTWFHFDTKKVAKLSWAATLQILGRGTSFHDTQYFLCTPGALIHIHEGLISGTVCEIYNITYNNAYISKVRHQIWSIKLLFLSFLHVDHIQNQNNRIPITASSIYIKAIAKLDV